MPGGAFPDISTDQKYVLLVDCMSLDEQNIDRYLLEESGNNLNSRETVLFNVNKKWDIQQTTCAQKVRGMFFQDDSKSVFIEGMCTILNGHNLSPHKPAPAHHGEGPPNSQSPEQQLNSLSQREKEILQHVSVGMKNTEIATELGITLNTVKTHIYNIYKKIGVSNRLQAAIWATAHDISQD